MPRAVAKRFIKVNTWATSLRYSPGTVKKDAAAAFMGDAAEVIQWAEERL